MLANLPIMLFPYALKLYPLFFFISVRYAHIILEYSNSITGPKNNDFNYLTFIILQHQGKFNVVLYCRDQIY